MIPLLRSNLIFSLISSLLIHGTSADTCSQVGVGALGSVETESSPAPKYLDEQLNYWSTGCSALKPSCIFFPKNATEVSIIVQALNANNETFAIKSGGHNPNKGVASIQSGPLISTRDLNEVTLDAAAKTVRVGPGNKWDDVQGKLDGTGYAVVGGRVGNVGVGGYVVGGGLSFLSTQYGWAANNVISYEVVLANATIVTASKTTNVDLYNALKGGGNNYAIVTSYLVEAHPVGQIWGGNYFFTADKTPQLLAAVRNFTENYPDEKAAIILTAERAVIGVIDIWIMFLFYDGPTPPAGVFDAFTAIGPVTNTCKTRSYADLLSANNFGVIKGYNYIIAGETMPLPSAKDSAEIMGAIHSIWRNTSESILAVPGVISTIAYQPIPKVLAQKAKARGGDLIDLDDDVDRIMFEYDIIYLSPTDDGIVDQATQRLLQGTRDVVTRYQSSGQLPDAYLPLFLNDCYFRQDYWGRLRTTDYARSVRNRYDPDGFFRDRTKGWKM